MVGSQAGSRVKVKLFRVSSSLSGTFGVMVHKGLPICVTCEDPWNDNKPNISCIPEGIYEAVPHSGVKYKNVWVLKNVPARSAILIHNGNTNKDTEGCILVGNGFALINGVQGVVNSIATLTQLRTILPDEFELEIINCY